MRVFGAILIVVGFLLCLSIVGAIIGVPMMLVGLILLVVGGRRKTIINNVVQVSNNAPAPVSFIDQSDQAARRREPRVQMNQPTYIEPAVDLPIRHSRAPELSYSPEFDVTYDDVEFTDVRAELS